MEFPWYVNSRRAQTCLGGNVHELVNCRRCQPTHTYASLLINQGESIKYVSKQLGHASIQITADLYGHLFKETSVSAMRRLSMRIEAPGRVTIEAVA